MQRKTTAVLSYFLLLTFCSANAQVAPKSTAVPNRSELTIEQIMQGEKFVGYLPEDVQWADDGRAIYFSWNPTADTLRSIWKVQLDSNGVAGPPAKVETEELMARPAEGYYNPGRSQKTYAKDGDIFLLDFTKNSKLQITNTLETEANPRLSGDGRQVVFEKNGNLFAWEISSGATTQLTDFQKGFKKKEEAKLPLEQWLADDQLVLFDILAERKATAETEKRRQKRLEPKRPKTYFFGNKKLDNLQFSPDLGFVTFRLIEEGAGQQTDVPNYVAGSGRVEQLRARPKVGAPEDATELGIYDRVLDSIFIVDPTKIEGIFDKPAFLKEYHAAPEKWEPKYKNARPVVWLGPVFSEGGKAVVMAKSQDNKDRWILLLDLPTGDLKLLHREHDDAWVGGPGISNYNHVVGSLGWVDGQRIWFQTEETGYSHLCLLNVETLDKQALTSGKFEVIDAKLSQDRSRFFITANRETPFERHFYHLPAGGGELVKITDLPGNHEVAVSPDEMYLAVRHSGSNRPWELFLMKNEPGGEMRQLTHSTTGAFEKYAWRQPEIIHFTAADGAQVPARLYRPKAGDRNGAAIIFVHGAGYLQNVHHWWSSYYREFMFHNLLADNGFTVLDIDYRGSQGYGRDWRTAIYRHMGGLDLSDQVDGARYLVEQHGIAAGRIGIYGGSYGGFITLMAQFTAPGTFKSGAALRSVTDWAHYNHEYTSNILNTPVEDSLAYRRSSPIYHAEGLQGNLLMLHGMVDVNVQFQDVVRLAQRLVELGKDDWELAVFPLEDHAFKEASSWSDEYRRIYKLFWETLRE